MKQKRIAAFILCLACYMTAAAYHSTLANQWKDEFSTPDVEKNPSRFNLMESSNPADSDSPKDSLRLNARYAGLMDAESGRVLYSKEGDKTVPMASTTKILTCILALENASLDDTVTVSKYASTMPDVQLNIQVGEQYKLKDLLYSLMLESHNDSAVAIAEHVGGSVEGFAAMMNAKATELGCSNTHFVTPNGLDAEGHYTTSIELCRIASYAIRNPTFLEITNTATYDVHELTNGRSFSIDNKDRFLTMYDGAIGVKTGFTSKAGYCFVGAVEKDDKTLVSAVLASGWPPNKNYKWSDTKKLMDYGMQHYNYQEIFHSNIPLHPIPVNKGQTNVVNLALDGTIGLLWSKSDVAYALLDLPSELNAPVASHTVVGKADFYVNDELFQTFPITTVDAVEEIDFPYCFETVLSYWTIRF